MGPLGQAPIRSCPPGQRAQDVLRRRVDRSIPRHPNTGQSFCGSHPTAKYLHHQRHSDPHHRWAGPPHNQGAPRRARSKVPFGAPPSLIPSRNFEPLPVPQVALRTLKPSGDSAIRTTHKSDRHTRCPPAAEGEATWNRSPSKPQPTSSVSSGTPSVSGPTRASYASPWTTTASAQHSELTSPTARADSATPAQSPTTSPTTPAPPASSSPCTPPNPRNPGSPNRTQQPSQH
jgi:hypothetical protein